MLLIVAAGLAVRVWVAGVSPAVSRDTCRFVWHAQGLQSSFVETLKSQRQHPLYPALVVSAHAVTGPWFEDSVLGWQVAAQAVAMSAGVLTCLAMYWLAGELFGRRTALLAALFAALLPEAVQYSADGLSDLPNALLYLLSLAAGVGALRGGRIWLWAVAGLCGGLAFLVRPEGLEAVIVVALVALAGRLEMPWRRRLVGLALLVAVSAAVCGPYMAVTGKVVPKKDVFQLLDVPAEGAVSGGTGNLPRASGGPEGDPSGGEVVLAAALPFLTIIVS